MTGILDVLFEIFKVGQRNELQKYIVKVLGFISLDKQSAVSTVRHF